MNCINPIKVYDSYVSCGQCENCKNDKSSFNLFDLSKICEYTKLQEKIKPSRLKMNYKKWWKRYVKIQKKIAVLNLKIKKLEEKI